MRIKSVYLTWHFCNKWIKCEVTSTHTDILRQPCRQFSSVQLAHSFQKRDLISAPVWLGHNMPRRQLQCFSFSLARPHDCRAIGKLLPLCWGAFAFALNGLKGIEALRCDDLVKKTGQSLRSWRTCQLFDMKKKTTLNFGSVVVFTSKDGVSSMISTCSSVLDNTWSHQEEPGREKRQKKIQHRYVVHDKLPWWRRLRTH